MIKTFVGIILSFHFLAANAKFSWTNCAPSDAILKVQDVEIGPDPLIVPGDLIMTMKANSTATLGSSSLKLIIKRKTSLLGEIAIPCLDHIGSCVYPELCTLVDQMIANNWLGVTKGVASQIKTAFTNSGIDLSKCQQPPQTLVVDHQSIHLPEIPSALSHFAAGDYHIHIELIDNVSKKINLCLDTYLNIEEKEKCTGFFCIFG